MAELEDTYRQLQVEEREVIATMWANKAKQKAIAQFLQRHPATISRELKRNCPRPCYSASVAQGLTHRRRQKAGRARRKMECPALAAEVKARLKERWSPEQIAGARKREFPKDSRQQISTQTIYTAIARDDHRQPLQKLLRRASCRKPGRKRKERACTRIACRPTIINERGRFGDWEGDTIVSAGHGREALITLVERRSRLVELIPVPNLKSKTVARAIHRRLKKYPPALRQSLTFDNGTEFSAWAWLGHHLKCEVYFAPPHSPWERGTNENMNGLVRQYFPKGTRFAFVTREQVRQAQAELNHRPRKILEFQTPLDILQQQIEIALQT